MPKGIALATDEKVAVPGVAKIYNFAPRYGNGTDYISWVVPETGNWKFYLIGPGSGGQIFDYRPDSGVIYATGASGGIACKTKSLVKDQIVKLYLFDEGGYEAKIEWPDLSLTKVAKPTGPSTDGSYGANPAQPGAITGADTSVLGAVGNVGGSSSLGAPDGPTLDGVMVAKGAPMGLRGATPGGAGSSFAYYGGLGSAPGAFAFKV